MLNFTVMRRAFFLFLFVLGMLWPGTFARAGVDAQEFSTPLAGTPTPSGTPTLTPGLPALSLAFPGKGETLRGEIPVTGDISLPGFTYWELAFSYAENPTGTWFPLLRGDQPVSGEIFRWNTAAIADGEYVLRLRVFFAEGFQDVLVTGLRVRNYSFDTATPSPSATFTRTPARTLPPRLPTATIAPTLTAFPSVTPLPPNPVSLPPALIWLQFVKGALLAAGALAIFGALLAIARKFSNQ
ncbi:MAG: hypothetical protein OHK0031_18780 [Anaerolineales bacterium]